MNPFLLKGKVVDYREAKENVHNTVDVVVQIAIEKNGGAISFRPPVESLDLLRDAQRDDAEITIAIQVAIKEPDGKK